MGFLLMMYPVSLHRMHHLPEVQDDAFDTTCQTMPVCAMQTGKAGPVTSMLCARVHHNQGL